MVKYKDMNHYLAINGVALAQIGHLKSIILVLGDKTGSVEPGLKSYLMFTAHDIVKELKKDLKSMDASVSKAARMQLDQFKTIAKPYLSSHRNLTAQIQNLEFPKGDA